MEDKNESVDYSKVTLKYLYNKSEENRSRIFDQECRFARLHWELYEDKIMRITLIIASIANIVAIIVLIAKVL